MTNSQILGTIEATNPVLTVAPFKELPVYLERDRS